MKDYTEKDEVSHDGLKRKVTQGMGDLGSSPRRDEAFRSVSPSGPCQPLLSFFTLWFLKEY